MEIIGQCQEHEEKKSDSLCTLIIVFHFILACSWTSHCVKDGWEASLGDKPPNEVKSLAMCKRKDLAGIPTYLPVKITIL